VWCGLPVRNPNGRDVPVRVSPDDYVISPRSPGCLSAPIRFLHINSPILCATQADTQAHFNSSTSIED
jgi:hypothetical protein